jgi:type II secretory pathway pseudopilin PulG
MFNSKFNSVSARRHGLSLIEIMIAMVMTLIVLGAMMAAFSYGSAEMQKGRASIELNNRLISAEEQLRRDLERITVEVKPHHALPALPKGYLEIVDGAGTDYASDNERPFTVLGVDYGTAFEHGGNELVFGDRDDYFACTIKSDGKAFRGRLGNNIVESHLAEVIWYTIPNPATADTTDHVLIRRQLLILPTAVLTGFTDIDGFFEQNDISARVVTVSGVDSLVANSLTELGIRGHRYCHRNTPPPPPAAVNPAWSIVDAAPLIARYNEKHVVCSSVAAFDIQVFSEDSNVFVLADGTIADPSDMCSSRPGGPLGTLTPLSGTFVDLGKGTGTLGGAMETSTNCNYAAQQSITGDFVYDTGTSQYNRNDDNDIGSNGVDDGGVAGVVDDKLEQHSIAPYDAPLRGLKFTMRVIEPNTKQVRQLTVKKSFVSE